MMDGRTTQRVKKLMEMAARPGGVLSREVEPDAVRAITEAGQRLVATGWLSVTRETRWDSRFSCTPETYERWRGDPQTVPERSASARSPGSAGTTLRSSAWWDKSARPHHAGYVEPRITSKTKVTICPPRTPQEWLHGAA